MMMYAKVAYFALIYTIRNYIAILRKCYANVHIVIFSPNEDSLHETPVGVI
jgi:hypothetical protein